MTYRELLTLYKTGALEPGQAAEVAADIEKQDAIGEYLWEREEIPGLAEPEETEPTPAEDPMIRQIRRTVRRSFLKAGFVTGAVVLLIVLGTIFLLPRLVSGFYYDPTDTVAENEYGGVTRQMSLDLAVYTELFVPCRIRTSVSAQPQGYGVYDIVIPQNISFNRRFTTVSGRLQRNTLTLYDTNTLRLPAGNAFLLPESVSDSHNRCIDLETGRQIGPAGSAEDALNTLEELDPRDWYIGYVSLRELTDYDALMEWLDALELRYGSLWCAVYAEDEDGTSLLENVGFSARGGGEILAWDTERYPQLSYMGPDAEDDKTTHFLSLLRYMDDHRAFAEMMAGGSFGPFQFRADKAAESIERDGLRIYGFAIGARPEDLITLGQQDAVSYIYTEPMP